MSTTIVELAPFTLRAGVTEQDLLRASAALQTEFLAKQDGFLRRELIHSSDRGWLDLVYWRDADAAARAMERAQQSAICLEYFRIMEDADHADAGAGVTLYSVLASYG